MNLPRLELSDHHRSPFDEAVIIIDGRKEETITIECPDALDLADLLIRLVNSQAEIVRAAAGATPDEVQTPYRAVDF